MALEKLTLFRNLNEESEKTSLEFKKKNIQFIEVFSNSEKEMPFLISSQSAYGFRGYSFIMKYVDLLYPAKQNS